MDEAKAVMPRGVSEKINLRFPGISPWRYCAPLGYLSFGLLGCLIMGLGEDSVLLVLSLTIYGFAGYIFLRQAGGFAITPATLFFLFFTIFTYIGGLTLFFSNGEGVNYGGGERNYIFYLALHGGILAIALGGIFATIAFGFSPQKEFTLFRRTPWRNVHNLPGDTVVITLIGLTALAMSALYVYNRGSLPLIQVLIAHGKEGLYELAIAARAEFSRYGRGAGSYFYQGYFQQFYVVILPFVTIYVGSQYLHNRKAKLLILWLVLGIITSFFLTLSLQRWPFMFFIIMNYVLYASYIGRIRVGHALAFTALALSLFGFLTYIRGYQSLAVVLLWIQERLFVTNVDVLYSIFEMFPRHFSYFGGQAFLSDIRGVLPGPDVAFARWSYDAVYQVYGNGTAPTIFWGELYADFGLPGVLVGSLAAGFVIQWVHIAFLRGVKDLLRLIIYTILTMASAELALTTPVTVMFQFGVVTIFLLVVALKAVRWIFDVRGLPHVAERAVIG